MSRVVSFSLAMLASTVGGKRRLSVSVVSGRNTLPAFSLSGMPLAPMTLNCALLRELKEELENFSFSGAFHQRWMSVMNVPPLVQRQLAHSIHMHMFHTVTERKVFVQMLSEYFGCVERQLLALLGNLNLEEVWHYLPGLRVF